MFNNARRLLLAVLLLSLLTPLILCLDGLVRARHQDREAGQWMKRLALTAPAFKPAGTPMRHPEMLPKTVDLRLTPLMPLDKRMVSTPMGAASGGVYQP